MLEVDGQLDARLDVAQHEERDEGQAGRHQQGEQQAVLVRLGPHGKESETSWNGVGPTVQTPTLPSPAPIAGRPVELPMRHQDASANQKAAKHVSM